MPLHNNRCNLVVPTTTDISEIHSIKHEDGGGWSSVYLNSTNDEAGISNDYNSFVSRQTGIIERHFGTISDQDYRVDVSARIDIGSSWQFGFFLAHALWSRQRLIQQNDPESADTILWVTGELCHEDFSIQPVGYIRKKIELSLKYFAQKHAQKIPVIVCLCPQNANQIPAGLKQKIEALGVTFLVTETLNDILIQLGLPQAWTGSPFRGLQVFEQKHRKVFFGRDIARQDALAQLEGNQNEGTAFLLVHGRSGAGKSSLVRAGLIGDIMESCPNTQWQSCTFTPNQDKKSPINALQAAISKTIPALARTEKQKENLKLSLKDKIVAPLIDFLEQQQTKLILVVDQLEELLLWGEKDRVDQKHTSLANLNAEEQNLFATILNTLACSGHVMVIATMRSDFLGLLDDSAPLFNLCSNRQYQLPRPNATQLRDIITRPLDIAGIPFDEGINEAGENLPDILASAASQNSDSLPLLQFVLSRLYEAAEQEQEQEQAITFEHYQRIGRLDGAIGSYADEIAEGLGTSLEIGRSIDRLILAIGRFDPGIEQAVSHINVLPDTISPVDKDAIETFAKARLIVMSDGKTLDETRGQNSKTIIIRPAHDALLEYWTRAKETINKNMDDLKLRDSLMQQARIWQEKSHAPDYLIPSGKALTDATALKQQQLVPLEAITQDYITTSQRHHKQQWNRLYRRAALAALLLLIPMGWYWNANIRIHTQYCANYAKVWEVPHCVGEMTSAQQKSRHLFYRIKIKAGRVLEMARINSYGTLQGETKFKYEVEPWEKNTAKWQYAYREDGKLSSILLYTNTYWRIKKLSYEFETKQLAYLTFEGHRKGFKIRQSEDISSLGMTHLSAATNRKTQIGRHRLEFNQHGQLTKRHFEPLGGDVSVADSNRAYGGSYQYHRNGLVKQKRNLNFLNDTLVEKNGVASLNFIYGKDGILLQAQWLDQAQKPALNDQLYARIRLIRDENRNTVEASFFGTDGQPALHKEDYPSENSYARAMYKYDGRGNMIEMTTFGIDGKLTAGRSTAKYDGRGNMIEVTVFSKEDVISQTLKLDAQQNILETATFGIDGKPTLNKDGVARYSSKHNSHGYLIEFATFGIDGKPTLIKNGYAIEKVKYDKRDNVIERAYFGTDGKLAVHNINKYAKITYNYGDYSGTVIEKRYDKNNKMIFTDKYSRNEH